MKSMTYKVLTASLIATGMFLGGCNSSSFTDPIPDPTPTPGASLTDSYNESSYGVVSAATVYDWVTDWEVNRPEHIGAEGRLFIIQFNTAMSGSSDFKYIKHNGESVITVDSGFHEFSETRNDGVSDFPSSLPKGETMDAGLAKLGINPNEDMLLFVSGDGKGLMGAARLWFTMSYWGVDEKNMALMNGSAIHQFQPNNAIVSDLGEIFEATASTLPVADPSAFSVKNLSRDTISLNASMQDMMDLVKGDSDDYLVVDARAANEYSGEKVSATEDDSCLVEGEEVNKANKQCFSAFTGHIKGAANINYTTLYNGDDHVQNGDLNGDGIVDNADASATFKRKTDLEAIYATAGYDGEKKLYTYCRTGARASINSFVQMQILGYETAMYDASWVQWGKMADRLNKDGLYNLAVDSEWRTDVEQYSDAVTYHPNNLKVNPINGVKPEGISTQAIILEDEGYL